MAGSTGSSSCRHHDEIEERLREKRDRITRLEMEVGHMKEKLDLIVIGQDKILQTVTGIKSWQTYLMGAAGVIAILYSVVTAHWGTITRIFGG